MCYIDQNKIINYPVKIHLPDCNCSYYKKKSKNRSEIIVAPYRTEEYKKRYFIYNTIKDLEKDIQYFEDNCVCTYNPNIFNGGVILLSKYGISDFPINETNEMTNFSFLKISNIFNLKDNSALIQEFYKKIYNQYAELFDWYVLIGQTRNTNYFSFPKGKIKFGETINMCCYREFEEETNYKIPESIISSKNQIIKRENFNIVLPLEIIINNFILKLIII
jgi:hypothetical protein